MARSLILLLDGEETSFGFKPIDRSDIYGKRKRVALDRDGQPCSRASLLDDGSLLLKSGMTAQGYFTHDGKAYKLADLQGFDADGNLATKSPSTLGVAQKLEGPLDPTEVLDLRANTIYLLEPEQLGPNLAAKLQDGNVYRFSFNYRDDYRAETGLLLSNENGFFALIGEPVSYEWASLEAVADLPPADSDSEDELDFEMF
jgi:hypothetical protein